MPICSSWPDLIRPSLSTPIRHPDESRGPALNLSACSGIPAFAGMTKEGSRTRLPCLRIHLLDMLPVDETVEKGLEIFLPRIAVVDVIGMLPHVAAEHRLASMHQRVLTIGCLGDGELAVLHRDPAPA